MEDLPYLSEGYEVQPPRISRLQRLEQDVANLEDYLRCGIYDQDYCDGLLEQIKDNIGNRGQDKESTLRAFGYALDHNDMVQPTLEVIDTRTAYRHDVEIRRVEDSDRVLIHYEIADEDTGLLASYYVSPLAILSNARERFTDVSDRRHHHVVTRYIRDAADEVREKVFGSAFFASDQNTQHHVLSRIAQNLRDSLAVEYGPDVPVSIGVYEYYQLPEDVDSEHIDWSQYRYESDSVSDESAFILEGTIINVVYLEMLTGLSDKITAANSLSVGHGLPCIILADHEHDAIYYIPAASIDSFHSETDE